MNLMPKLSFQSQPQPQQEYQPEPIINEPELQAGSIEEVSHFDALISNAPEIEEVASTGNILPATQVGVLSKDDFHELFCGGFEAASLITDLKSLHVEKTDGKAKAASGALYDTISEIPALRFIIEPQGKIAQRLLVLGVFFGGMARNVSLELNEKRAAAISAFEAEEASPVPEYNGLRGDQ